MNGAVVESVYKADSKSAARRVCGFESLTAHQNIMIDVIEIIGLVICFMGVGAYIYYQIQLHEKD